MKIPSLKKNTDKTTKQASRWFIFLRSKPITPSVDNKFREWLESDDVNETWPWVASLKPILT